MKQTTILALVAAASALATASAACLEELQSAGGTTEAQGTPSGEGEPAKPRRGRPPAGEKPAAAEATEGKTLEELKAAIKPLIDDARGPEVKALITKHGGTILSEIPAANHAAFLKDIEGISY